MQAYNCISSGYMKNTQDKYINFNISVNAAYIADEKLT